MGGSFVDSEFNPQELHVYAIEWEPTEIRWYVDEINYNVIRSTDVSGRWVYDHLFFIILNVAVGGDWPGSPNGKTEFPQQMVVDYVRVDEFENLDSATLSSGGESQLDSISYEEKEEGGDRWGEIIFHLVNQNEKPVDGVRVTASRKINYRPRL